MKCPSFEELQSFSKDDLKRLYDRETANTYVGINFILDEISRREQAKENKRGLAVAELSLLVSILSFITSLISLFSNT